MQINFHVGGRAIRCSGGESGVALLSALWLTLILGAIAFGVAAEVRTSVESTSNNIGMSQARYFAEGGIYAAIAAIQASRGTAPNALPPDAPDQYRDGKRWMAFGFGEGVAITEVVPENAKLSINYLTGEQVNSLQAALTQRELTDASTGDALLDWRSAPQSSVDSAFDAHYAQAQPPYRANHAVLQDLEELLAVKGFGRELFYGSLGSAAGDGEFNRPALLDVLTAETQFQSVNINYAPVTVLATLPGWTLDLARDVVAARQDDVPPGSPFQSLDDLVRRIPAAAAVVGISSLSLNSGNLFTITATGLARDSGLLHTTRCLVRMSPQYPQGYKVIGWWDDWPWAQPPAGVMAALKETR